MDYSLKNAIKVLKEENKSIYYTQKKTHYPKLGVFMGPRVKLDPRNILRVEPHELVLCKVERVIRFAWVYQKGFTNFRPPHSKSEYHALVGDNQQVYGWTNIIYGVVNENYYRKE